MKICLFVQLLEALGSEEDPIQYQGKATTPNELADNLPSHYQIKSLGFFSRLGYQTGTPLRMILDRAVSQKSRHLSNKILNSK